MTANAKSAHGFTWNTRFVQVWQKIQKVSRCHVKYQQWLGVTGSNRCVSQYIWNSSSVIFSKEIPGASKCHRKHQECKAVTENSRSVRVSHEISGLTGNIRSVRMWQKLLGVSRCDRKCQERQGVTGIIQVLSKFHRKNQEGHGVTWNTWRVMASQGIQTGSGCLVEFQEC